MSPSFVPPSQRGLSVVYKPNGVPNLTHYVREAFRYDVLIAVQRHVRPRFTIKIRFRSSVARGRPSRPARGD